MKNLLWILLFCSCMISKDPDEYESQPAMLVTVERVERFTPEFGVMRVMQKKQTWEFLSDHYRMIRYVDTTNREEIGTVALRDRRR